MRNKKYYPWVVVGLLWFVALLNYMDRQILATLRPAMSVDIPDLENAAIFGNLMAIFLWIYGLMSPISGILADKINRKYLIVGSLLVWSLVTAMMGFTHSYSELYILRAIMGLSEAIYLPAGLALIADYHGDKTRSLAIGVHMTGLYLGQALGGFGGTVADELGWTITFKVLGFVGVFYAAVLMILLVEIPNRFVSKEVSKTEKKKWSDQFSGLRSLLGNFSFWIILLYFAIPSLPGWATKNWLPTLFADTLQIPMAQAGPLATITIAGSSLVGVLFGGILSDRWIQRNKRGRIITSGIGIALTIPALFLLGFGSNIIQIVLGGAMFGFGFGMFDANNMPILCQFVSSKNRATAYGFMNMVGVFAGAIITKVLGSSVQAGKLGHDFAMLAIIVAVVLVVQQIFLKPKSKESLL